MNLLVTRHQLCLVIALTRQTTEAGDVAASGAVGRRRSGGLKDEVGEGVQDQTRNRPITRRPALPPELRRPGRISMFLINSRSFSSSH